MKLTGTIIRQGDVYLIPVEIEAKDNLGQARSGRWSHTGEGGSHVHVLDGCEILDTELGATILRLSQPSVLRHVALYKEADQGHLDLNVPAGTYEARIQKEYRPDSRRVHAD